MIDFTGLQKIDQTESPYYKAFERMEENTPPHPLALLEKLGAYVDNHWASQPLPNFRGWFGQIGGRGDIWNWEAIPSDADLNDISYVGIWRGVVASKERPIIWCVLPSMIHGDSIPGEIIEIGKERVRIGYKQEELDALVVAGYEIMMGMIAERGEYEEITNESIGA
jgi:hypothetical protein